MGLHDGLELIDDPAGDVLPHLIRKRVEEAAGELQIMALGVSRIRGVHAEHERGTRLR